MTGRILLVEADVVLGAVLAEVLRHNGYEVIVAKTLIKGEIDCIHSMNAVILDIDTTPAEKELAWLDALWPYRRVDADRFDGSAGIAGTAQSSALTTRAPEDRHSDLGAEAVSE